MRLRSDGLCSSLPAASTLASISSFPLAAVKEKPYGIALLSIVPLHITIASRYKHVTLEVGGMQWGRAEMEHFYRDHRVELSVGLDGNAWTVSLFIYYSEGLLNILVTFPMNQEFKTYDDAMEAGLAAAKKWIDERTSNPRH
jgi:hypothetical protein